MTEITKTKENIKVLRRLLISEKYMLRQYKAHKKLNQTKKK